MTNIFSSIAEKNKQLTFSRIETGRQTLAQIAKDMTEEQIEDIFVLTAVDISKLDNDLRITLDVSVIIKMEEIVQSQTYRSYLLDRDTANIANTSIVLHSLKFANEIYPRYSNSPTNRDFNKIVELMGYLSFIVEKTREIIDDECFNFKSYIEQFSYVRDFNLMVCTPEYIIKLAEDFLNMNEGDEPPILTMTKNIMDKIMDK